MGLASTSAREEDKNKILTGAQSNPEEPLYLAKGPRTNLYHGITLLQASCIGSKYDWEAGETTFGYQFDFTRFETGYIIIVKYERNIPERTRQGLESLLRSPLDDPMENQILDAELGNMPFTFFNNHILPKLRLESYITTIDFYTDSKGNPCIGRETQCSLEDIPYNMIPANLATARVRLSELVAPETYRSHHPYIKIVLYSGNLYAYKFHGVIPQPFGSTTYNDDLLREVMELSKFNSPFILPPSFIVTDRNNTGQFRGFLHPFLPAGSILDVFKSVHRIEQRSPRHRRFSTQDSSSTPYDPRVAFLEKQRLEKRLYTPEQLAISWSVKLSWSVDIASAIKVLHEASSFSGDFTLDNFLVDPEGHIRMIDIAPVRGFTLCYAPPELEENGDLTLCGPRDIYNLGVVLWTLSEEIIHLEPESPSEIAGVTWRGGESSAPAWYRELVGNCMQAKPQYRPSAAVILLILEEHLEGATYLV